MLLLTEIHLQSLAFPASRALMRSWSRPRLIPTQITIKGLRRKINCVRSQSFGLGTILWVADNHNYWVITAPWDGNFPRSDQRSRSSWDFSLCRNQELFWKKKNCSLVSSGLCWQLSRCSVITGIRLSGNASVPHYIWPGHVTASSAQWSPGVRCPGIMTRTLCWSLLTQCDHHHYPSSRDALIYSR